MRRVYTVSFSTEVMAHELAHQWFGDLGEESIYCTLSFAPEVMAHELAHQWFGDGGEESIQYLLPLRSWLMSWLTSGSET